MSFDPFLDDAPEPTANDWLADSTPVVETPVVEKKEIKTVTAANASEGKLTITLKGGAGFDAPWIVIHAQDASDGLAQMKDPALKELMDLVKKGGAHFSGGTGQATQRPAAKPAGGATPQAPAGDGKSCQHGDMIFRSGSKNGKTWKGYFCPTPKGTPDQCAPEFVR